MAEKKIAAPNPTAEQLWTANDVAKYLQVSRSWVYQKSEAGQLPCLRIGGLVRFIPAQVMEWARGGVAAPTTAKILPLRPPPATPDSAEGPAAGPKD